MAFRRENGLAIWRQIAEAIRGQIRDQGMRPGERLPTETELAARFEVNRHTVRQALAFLQDSGEVHVEQGRGTFVARDPVLYPVGRRTRFTEIVRLQQRLPGGTLLRAQTIEAQAAMARDLDVAPGEALSVLEVLHTADGQPLCLTAHHFVIARVGDLEPALRATGSVTAALRKAGVADYVRKLTRLGARRPTNRETGILRIARTRPVLVSEAVNTLPDGTPIELGLACFPADRVQIVVES
ncbi:MAG: phosphonate metabolism transcriptional regulator PhnF [Alphaproteobacteria bacterium]